MLKRDDILDYLKKHKDFFRDKFNIEKIGIFGSYARNEQTEKSDIDIIIEMPRGTDEIFEKKELLRNMLKEQFHKKIDICRERSIKPLFKDLILKDTIYV
ncbi:MAG: nucleotidyltransferase domain-containing protein [Candidatus Kapabacteria bacterium]|nr:nucleotidyltransferase domain-containing protein [Ignavibacteriota bacterium]MCW5884097.1 nucleotidyltransferase domain-containing protein [Candidatus Kapabacteria bacterium]